VLAEIDSATQAALENTVKTQDIDVLKAVVEDNDKIVAAAGISHKVAQFIVDPATFSKSGYDFASQYVADAALNLCLASDEKATYEHIRRSLANPATMSKYLLESYIRELFSSSKPQLTVRIRRLPRSDITDNVRALLKTSDMRIGFVPSSRNAAAGTIILKIDHVRSQAKLADLSSWAPGTRLIMNDSFAGIDYVESCGALSNATTNQEHQLLMLTADGKGGVSVVARALNAGHDANDPIPYFWLVPPALFDKFPAQHLIINKQTVSKHTTSQDIAKFKQLKAQAEADMPCVVQYVVSVPVPPVTTSAGVAT
jgi:hypothetical protein